MPKKTLGVNTKSVEAKARKDAAKREKEEQMQKSKEDEYWRDDDKHINRKLERQNEREKKRLDVAQRKAANKAVHDEEMNQLATIKAPAKNVNNSSSKKITRSQIQANLSKQAEERTAPEEAKKLEKTHLEVDIVENVNRMTIEGDEARNIDEAITILGTTDRDLDRHPERRLKAAYTAFEELHLPRLKRENPNLRLSQLKQMLKKDWMKSPDNPMNQRALAYNQIKAD